MKVKQDVDHKKCINSCGHVVENNARSFRQTLKLPRRRRLKDVEDAKENKTNQKCLPGQGNGNQSYELSRNFIDDDELWVLGAGRPGSLGRCRDSHENGQNGKDDGTRRSKVDRQVVIDCRPDQYRGYRSPCSRSGSQAADSEESRSEDG